MSPTAPGSHVVSYSDTRQRDERCPFEPPPLLGRLREDEPVARISFFDGREAWLVTGHELGAFVLTDTRFSVRNDLPGFPFVSAGAAAWRKLFKIFPHMDNPEHRHQRHMLLADFSKARMRELRPRVQQIVDETIDAMIAQGPPVDLVTAFALPIPSLVICELLGVPSSDLPYFVERAEKVLSSSSTEEEAKQAGVEVLEYFVRLVTERVALPVEELGDDLIDRVIREQVHPGQLDVETLADMARIVMVAGHDTSASQIALGVLALDGQPEQRELLLAGDDAAVQNAVDELLRYLTVVQHGIGRVALEDIQVGDVTVRAGEGVLVALGGGNRDASVFPEPHKLDLARPEARKHLAFGSGTHRCLGEPLAELELAVAYPSLWRRLPGLRVAEPLEAIRFKHDNNNFGPVAVPVTW